MDACADTAVQVIRRLRQCMSTRADGDHEDSKNRQSSHNNSPREKERPRTPILVPRATNEQMAKRLDAEDRNQEVGGETRRFRRARVQHV